MQITDKKQKLQNIDNTILSFINAVSKKNKGERHFRRPEILFPTLTHYENDIPNEDSDLWALVHEGISSRINKVMKTYNKKARENGKLKPFPGFEKENFAYIEPFYSVNRRKEDQEWIHISDMTIENWIEIFTYLAKQVAGELAHMEEIRRLVRKRFPDQESKQFQKAIEKFIPNN